MEHTFLTSLIAIACLLALFSSPALGSNDSWGKKKFSATESHNYYFGVDSSPKRNLLFDSAKERSSSIVPVRRGKIKYPEKGRVGYKIKYIEIKDYIGGGKGGYAKITKGGVGFKYVTIRFKSQALGGFNFGVTIDGYCITNC